jgi:hypothetical protein
LQHTISQISFPLTIINAFRAKEIRVERIVDREDFQNQTAENFQNQSALDAATNARLVARLFSTRDPFKLSLHAVYSWRTILGNIKGNVQPTTHFSSATTMLKTSTDNFPSRTMRLVRPWPWGRARLKVWAQSQYLLDRH